MATYYGTTAATSLSNPPTLMVEGVGGTPSIWTYTSTNTSTDWGTANFFTDAKRLGVIINDVALFVNAASTTAPKAGFGVFGAVTTSGAALQSAVSSTAA